MDLGISRCLGIFRRPLVLVLRYFFHFPFVGKSYQDNFNPVVVLEIRILARKKRWGEGSR